jgi:uncharacterized protein YecT (DUF1311 family)
LGFTTPNQTDIEMKSSQALLAGLLLLSNVAFAAQNCSVLNERDKETCVKDNYLDADGELNNVYRGIVSGLEEPEPLRKAQRAWVKFRDAECNYVGSWETLTKNGPWLNRYKCLEELTTRRIERLLALKEMHEDRAQDYTTSNARPQETGRAGD